MGAASGCAASSATGARSGSPCPQPSWSVRIPHRRSGHPAQADAGGRGGSDRAEGPEEGERGEAERPTAVIIEDDPNSAELLSLHLGAAGLRTVVAVRRAEPGCRPCVTMRPDVVVLDIRLPGMDGWDVLTEIKSDPVVAATPVVVVSVLPNRSRGIALGASDYLVKPVARDDLLEALRRLGPCADRTVGSTGRRHGR